MGLSASQARMLSLTARLSDLELRAQTIENAKIRLSDQAEQASNAYSNALDKQTLKVYSGLQSDGTSSYIDATAYNLTTYNAISTTDKQRFIQTTAGQVLVSNSVKTAYDDATSATTSNAYSIASIADKNTTTVTGNTTVGAVYSAGSDAATGAGGGSPTLAEQQTNGELYVFLQETLGYYDLGSYNNTVNAGNTALTELPTDASNAIAEETKIFTGYNAGVTTAAATGATSDEQAASGQLQAFLTALGVDPSDSGAVNYNTNLFNEIQSAGGCVTDGTQDDSNLKNSDWLQSEIDGGNIYLYEYDPTAGSQGTGDFTNVSWSSGDAALQETTDTTDQAKAEAQYETTMASIQSKDKRFDMQLADIDTEHTAVQTEIDSVKKVIDKNIERSFKIFDA